MTRNARLSVLASAGLAVGAVLGLAADTKKKAAPAPARETVAKPMTERQKRQQAEKLRKELETPYRKWLNEDVAYIITPEEQTAFKRLSTDEEREQFIEQFWLRRDPTPDSAENEFKEEHYRRIAYANDRFASGIPGWKTDRGRIYIAFGPADEIEDNTGGSYERPIEEGGGTTSVFPFQKWRYRYIEGVGSDIIIEFVDPTMTGEFRMTMDPTEKDALMFVPNAGLTMYEQMGLASKTDRFTRTDGTRLGTGDQPLSSRMNQFDRLQQYTMLQKPPAIKFKDLEAMVTSSIKYNMIPLQIRTDYIRMTDSTVMANVTVQIEKKDLQFQDKEGVSRATLNMALYVTSISRRRVFNDEQVVTLDVPTEMLGEFAKGSTVYQKAIPLPPGSYRLNLVVKDIIGGGSTNHEMSLNVPRYEEDKLGMSSIILADLIQPVPTREIGTGQFVIGGEKVRPRLSETFDRSEKLGIYVQLYNFTADEKTHKPDATIDYEIVKNGTNEKVLEFTEEVGKKPNASAQQHTVEYLLPLKNMEPGEYTLKMKVTDRPSNQVLTPTARFKVK